MAATYNRQGIRFLYPETWQVTDEDGEGWPRVVTLQSSESGFWSLHVYRAGEDPIPLVNEVEQTMRREYQGLEAERVSQTLGAHPAVGCDLEFYCLDLLVSARARAVRTEEATYLVFCQAESREFEVLLPVFESMTLSMLGVVESGS
jgi:hypothetical protein